LNLGGTLVTDDGLQHRRKLTNLTQLYLTYTAVSDTGLPYLDNKTKLEFLHLMGTRVTPNGEARLRLALPGLKEIID
jgi:hypothetical protein